MHYACQIERPVCNRSNAKTLMRSMLMQAIGSGLWPIMVLLSEVVQTMILADFCYYYVKAYASGIELVQLPAGIV